MKKPPYTIEEAEQLCKEYQYLIGRKFTPDSNLVVECITITPFDEINKKRFLIFYFLFNNAKSALSHEYKGFLFDIIVIGRSKEDEHELLQEDLHIWLAENKIVSANNNHSGNDTKAADEVASSLRNDS